MPTLERFKRNGAAFAESLGDSYPELESKGFTVNGDPQVVDTPYGKGMSFDGTGDYLVYSPSSNILQTDSAFTVSTWVKFDDFSDFRTIWSKQTSTSSTGLGVGLYVSTSGIATLYFFDGSGNIDNTNSATLSTDTWYLITATYDGSSACRLYINTTVSNNTVSGFSPAPAQNFTIGRLSYTNAFPHKGDATQVLVFPRALSAQEVSDLYNQTTFNYMDNLVSRWDMSEINPQDLTGSNDGTGTSIVASDIVVGQHGDAKAINFDGTNDYIEVPDSSSLDIGSDSFSLAAWVKFDDLSTLNTILVKASGHSVGNTHTGYLFGINGSTDFGLEVRDGTNRNGVYSNDNSVSNNGQWYFLSANRDSSGSGSISLFLNGSKVTTTTNLDVADLKADVTNASTLRIAYDGTATRGVDGNISEVYVFDNIALTELQVRDLYEQTRSSSKSTSRINNPAYLKAYLPLNSHTDDVSGNGNDGTATSLTYTDGVFGRTVGDFNGSSSKVSKQLDVTGYSQITFSCWVNLDAIVSSLRIMSILHSGSDDIRLLVSATEIRFTMDDGTATGVSGDTLVVGKPVFVTGVYDGTNIRVYTNGVLNDTASSASFDFAGADGLFTIGAGSSGSFFVNSKIWNVRVYDVALTGEEIQQIYRMEQSVPHMIPAQQPYSALPDITDSFLVASYLNSANNGTAKDYSNNNNDGTATAVVLGNNQGAFDGADSIFNTNSSTIVEDGALTFAVTFNANSLGEGTLGRFVSNGRFIIDVAGTNTIRVMNNGTGGTILTTDNSVFSFGETYRLVVTRNSTGDTTNIYLNGSLIKSGDADTPSSIASDLRIGNSSGTNRTWDGILKDVEIYNEAKDASWVSQDYSKRVPDNNLQLWLKDSLDDKSRYNRTGTTVNIIEGNKLDFNGTDSVFSTGSDWIGTDDITLMGWINPDSFGEANEGRIFDNGKTIFFINSTLNRLRFTSDGGTTQSRADNAISTGQWQHVAVTRNGTMSTLYVNGVDVTDVGDSGTPASGSTVVFIGNNQAGSRTFDGKMDDVRGYNRILTASEIKSHYLQTRGQY